MFTNELIVAVTVAQTGCIIRVERRESVYVVNVWGSECDADDSPLTYNTLADALRAVYEQISADCNEE